MDPVTDSGGRVTRSLRKRIPSVDNENTSRPGTPVPSKLTAIIEISSPSRPARITRRNSVTGVATPVKTPAKRAGATTSVISETTESVTPARRSTRRRSLSTNESEGTPQAAIKAPAFDTLDEETPANIKQTIVRLKRLQSLSPQQLQTLNTPDKRVVKTNFKSPEEIKSTDKINIKAETKTPEQVIKKSPHEIKKINDTGKQQVKEEIKSPQQSNISTEEIDSATAKAQQRRKPGPKSKTRQLKDEIDDLSDVEVINIEKEIIKENEIKANLTTIDLIDDDEDDNDNEMTNKTKLEETSPKHIEDNVTSTQSPEICFNKNKLNYKADQNVTTIDLMDCDDEQPLDNTNVMSTQEENQQNLTTIDLMETNITTIDLMDCDDTQNVDDIEELSAKETVKPPESSTIEAEISKIDVRILPQVAPNTEHVNESPSSTQLESTTVDINEEMSCESKPQETSGNESSLKTNETLLKETKSIEISTKETLESKKTQETTEIETSVVVNETLLNESKSEDTPTKGTCEIKKTKKTSMMVNETLLNKSKSKETPTKWNSENKKTQETSEIETSVMLTETLLNEPKSKEIPTKETSKIIKPQETSQIENSVMVTETLLNESKSKEIPTKGASENKKTQETAEIETSVMVNETLFNESKSKETSEIKNTQETSEIETSEMVNETLLNESKSEEIPTKGTLDFQKPEETSEMETSVMVNETLLNESKEIPTKATSEIEKPQENSEIESEGIVNEHKSLEISTIATLENKKTQEIPEIETAMIINETLNVSKSDDNPTKDIPEDTKPKEVLEVETSMIINESKSDEIPAKEIFENNKPQEISRVESSVVINETLNETKFHEIPTKKILEKNVQETNKTQPIIEINDETIDSTKTDNSHDQDCTSTQTDEIIPSIMANSDSQKDSYLKVEENTKICTTPQPPQRKSTATIIEVINITPTQLKSNAIGCKSSKNVDFIMSPSGDSMIKSVYPKTPAFVKTKSLLEIETQRDMNEETTNSSMCNEKGVTDEKLSEHQPDNEQTTLISEEIHKMEVHQNKVIPKLKQSIVNSGIETPPKNTQDFNRSQNSTPNDAWKIENDLQLSNNEVTKSKPSLEKNLHKPKSLETKLENNNECTSSDKVETELKWINACVKGTTTEGGKLDAVVKPKATPKPNTEDNEMDDQHLSQTRRSKAIIFSSDSEGEEDERVQPDDDEEEELAPGEKPYKRRHIFHDDEAMEVEDYESGDSMDSEERREMLDNEVPLDGESIGSNTTDDEHDDVGEDGEESENDSFIVSDNEEVEPLQLESSENSDDEDDLVEDEHDRKKKKTYKRIQRSREPSSSSSSSDEEEHENDTDKKSQSNTVESPNKSMNKSLIKSSDNNVLDTSKLSDTALRLQCTADSDSEEQIDELNANISRKEILRKLNQSDRFNKSVRDLNPEVETSPNEPNNQTQYKSNSINIKEDKVDLQKSVTLEKSMPKDENAEQSETENEDYEENQQEEEEEKSCTEQDSSFGKSSDENVNVNQKISKEKQAEFSHLGEVSVTTESDNDKENTNKNKLSSTLNRSALSVSFGNFPKSKKQSIHRRSFTIGISSKGDEAEIKLIKQVDSPPPSASSSSSQTSPSTNAKKEEELSSDDDRYLENIKHMPLGNPLVRTRRQSLALPTNPDMEICSSSHGGTGISVLNKKTKRKSLGLLSGHEFNPSQSFVDSMELRKNEFDRQAAKRKRLSKSFCGTADTMDNSTIDIDVRHLHKRSKLSAENSIIMDNYDSMENINSSKFSTVVTTSSTPREKAIENDSNNNINNTQTKLLDKREKSIKNVSTQRLLSRCHEYLEAANQAKLLDKLKNKKIKNKPTKKNRKKTPQQSIRELHQDSDDKRKSNIKDHHNEEKTKAALAQALKAAEVIIVKKNQKELKMVEKSDSEDSKRLSPDILEAINKSEQITKKKNKRDIPCSEYKMRHCHTTSTAAGNFIDMPQTPEKKKKKVKIIQLPTGKVCVEPITPKHRSVLACNGTVFRESSLSPFPMGFKVSHIPCDGHHATILKDRKRKRNFDDPTRHNMPKPQWTQSGLFIEEEIPTMHHRIIRSDVTQCSGSRRFNHHQTENDQYNAHWNFKENAIMRHDIKRCTNRELLQLKERRQMQSQF